MAKSKILKELANNEIDLEVALSRLMIIASDINNNELCEWAENELNGYSSTEKVPPYRVLGIGSITYSGINGRMQMTNQPLPVTAFTPKERELITETRITQSISSLQKFAAPGSKEKVGRDLTFLAESFYQHQGVKCFSISMQYSHADFVGVLSRIRTKLLSVFLQLDKEFGNLNELDINISEIGASKLENIKENLRSIIYSNNKTEVL